MTTRKVTHSQPGQLALFEELAGVDVDEPAVPDVEGTPVAPRSVEDVGAGGQGGDSRAAAGHAGATRTPSLAVDVPAQGDGAPAPPALAAAAGATPSPATRARRVRPFGTADAAAPAQPRTPPSPSATLDQAIPQYLEALGINRSQHTVKSFELDLRLLRGQLGNRAVGVITTGDLRQFIAWVRVTRQNKDNSLRRKVATLKNFFGYLRDEGYLTASPADAVPYPEVQFALPEFLETDAAERLVAVTEGNPFWRALIVLMLDTGLKRDEVLALRVADVYLQPIQGGESYVVVRETDAAKRLRTRRVPVTERLYDALQAYDAAQPREGGESRVFDISIRGVNFIVEVCGQRAGVVTSKPRLTPQVLRETFAVTRMRLFVAEERQRRQEAWTDEQLQLLTLKHDGDLLRLLGLKDDPDTAQKYRQLAGNGE